MNPILYLIILSSTSVVFLFLIAKLLGKRQVSQLDFMDYVIGISIGSIAAEMATDINEKPLYYYLISISIYFLFDLLTNFFGRKLPFLKHFLKGKPITIIYGGQIIYKNLKKSKLSVNDILSQARDKGYFNILDIYYAVLENNGKLSIMPTANKTPCVVEDLKIIPPEPKLPYYLVIDGKISFSTLTELNKNKDWLLKNLNIANPKEYYSCNI